MRAGARSGRADQAQEVAQAKVGAKAAESATAEGAEAEGAEAEGAKFEAHFEGEKANPV